MRSVILNLWSFGLLSSEKNLERVIKTHYRPKKSYILFTKSMKRKKRKKIRRQKYQVDKIICNIKQKKNNIFVTFYENDRKKEVFYTDTVGYQGMFKGPKKRTFYAAEVLARRVADKINFLFKSKTYKPGKFKGMDVRVVGPWNAKMKASLKIISESYYGYQGLFYYPIISHNGVRKRKARRK